MRRKANWIWLIFGLLFLLAAASILFEFSPNLVAAPTLLDQTLRLVALSFPFVGALIITHQPRNVIGWLLMLPAMGVLVPVDNYLQPYNSGILPPPTSPSLFFLLAVWFSNWSWLLLIFPLIYILILFPTGKPLSRRWGLLIPFGLVLAAVVMFASTFGNVMTTEVGGSSWSVPNPIGLDSFTDDWINNNVLPVFEAALPLWVLLCVVSLLVRFRKAQKVEREQIKWLFLAAIIFALSYIPVVLTEAWLDEDSVLNYLWTIGMLAIPIAIGIAILRYRLYDINVIIRKTLIYALLTGLLALAYFGTVLILQSLFEMVSGQQSPLLIVISTLIIAALFRPLRARVQVFIDRRFYRRRYDSQQVLDQFARTARDEVSLEAITAELSRAVQETLQPEQISVWVRPIRENQHT